MSNDKLLPEEMQDQIKADSISTYPIPVKFSDQVACMERREGYIAGATAWAAWKVKFDELEAAYLALQMDQMLLKQQDGKEVEEPKPEGWPWICEHCGRQDCESDHK